MSRPPHSVKMPNTISTITHDSTSSAVVKVVVVVDDEEEELEDGVEGVGVADSVEEEMFESGVGVGVGVAVMLGAVSVIDEELLMVMEVVPVARCSNSEQASRSSKRNIDATCSGLN